MSTYRNSIICCDCNRYADYFYWCYMHLPDTLYEYKINYYILRFIKLFLLNKIDINKKINYVDITINDLLKCNHNDAIKLLNLSDDDINNSNNWYIDLINKNKYNNINNKNNFMISNLVIMFYKNKSIKYSYDDLYDFYIKKIDKLNDTEYDCFVYVCNKCNKNINNIKHNNRKCIDDDLSDRLNLLYFYPAYTKYNIICIDCDNFTNFHFWCSNHHPIDKYKSIKNDKNIYNKNNKNLKMSYNDAIRILQTFSLLTGNDKIMYDYIIKKDDSVELSNSNIKNITLSIVNNVQNIEQKKRIYKKKQNDIINSTPTYDTKIEPIKIKIPKKKDEDNKSNKSKSSHKHHNIDSSSIKSDRSHSSHGSKSSSKSKSSHKSKSSNKSYRSNSSNKSKSDNNAVSIMDLYNKTRITKK